MAGVTTRGDVGSNPTGGTYDPGMIRVRRFHFADPIRRLAMGWREYPCQSTEHLGVPATATTLLWVADVASPESPPEQDSLLSAVLMCDMHGDQMVRDLHALIAEDAEGCAGIPD